MESTIVCVEGRLSCSSQGLCLAGGELSACQRHIYQPGMVNTISGVGHRETEQEERCPCFLVYPSGLFSGDIRCAPGDLVVSIAHILGALCGGSSYEALKKQAVLL